ncbi:MAG: hypothetical protein Q9221_006586 [Calogaya cf. arnoldii]
MGLSAVVALQLLQLFSQIVNSATLPSSTAGSIQGPEQQQTFDETTTRLKEQGLCRLYDNDSPGQGYHGLETCEPKCGELVEKSKHGDYTEFLKCQTKGSDTPETIDPSGQRYTSGECACKAPVTDQLIDDVSMRLPAVDDIGCSIVYEAFDAILENGPTAIPNTGASMDVGLKAAAQAAKTVAVNGKDANTFLDWLDISCKKDNYTDVAEEVYGPLAHVPDSVISSLGCKSKLCARKKASTKASSKAPSKPKPKTPGKSSPEDKGKNNPKPKESKKSSSTATTKVTKPTEPGVQPTSSKVQALATSTTPSKTVSPLLESSSVSLDPSSRRARLSSSTEVPLLATDGQEDTTFLTFTHTKPSSSPTAKRAPPTSIDALDNGEYYPTSTDGAQDLATKASFEGSPTSTETSELDDELPKGNGDEPNPKSSGELTTSAETSNVDIQSPERTDNTIPSSTTQGEPEANAETPTSNVESSEEPSPEQTGPEEAGDTSSIAPSGESTTNAETPDVDVVPSEETGKIPSPTSLEAPTASQVATGGLPEIPRRVPVRSNQVPEAINLLLARRTISK